MLFATGVLTRCSTDHFVDLNTLYAEGAMSVAGAVDVRRTGSVLVEYTDPSLTEGERAQILESVAGAHDSDC